MRVLIADDDVVAAKILSSALSAWNLDVTVATNGADAWRHLETERPPLAIFDWMMPELDGPELCRRVRATPAVANTYVILLSAREASADMIYGLDAGADDYVTKPFNREELRARVHVGVRVASLQQTLNERIAELQRALGDVKQLEGLLSICSYCKKIRAGAERWEQMEQYISEHSNTHFSHGVCPTCFERVQEDFTR